MKKSTLALVVMGIVASASVQAAEIYNKDGNKLDVYGKVKAMHYMSDNASKDGDQSYIRFGFKGETQINWICPYISRHLLSLNPLLACCRRYSRGER